MSRWFFRWLPRSKTGNQECTRILESKFACDFRQRFPLGNLTSMFREYRPPDAMATGVHAYWQSPMRDGEPVFLADEVLTWIDRLENIRIDALCSQGVVHEYRIAVVPTACHP